MLYSLISVADSSTTAITAGLPPAAILIIIQPPLLEIGLASQCQIFASSTGSSPLWGPKCGL